MAKLLYFYFLVVLIVSTGYCDVDGDVDTTDKTTAPPPTPPPTPAPTPSPSPPPTQTPSPTPPAPTQSPTPPPTPAPPAPAPSVKNFNYNVTDNKTVCIMISGTISIAINYTNSKTNKTQINKIVLPKANTAGVNTTGECGTDEQNILITWGPEALAYTVEFKFDHSKDLKEWNLNSLHAQIPFDGSFNNASLGGKNLDLNITMALVPASVPVNQSYSCVAHLSDKKVSGIVEGEPYILPVVVTFDKIQMQAFNKIKNEPDFVEGVHCAADKTSDIIPIAVGCALGGLVVIVLIAYIVGRSRQSAAYQSV